NDAGPGFLQDFPRDAFAQRFAPFERASRQRPLAGVTAPNQKPPAVFGACRRGDPDDRASEEVASGFPNESKRSRGDGHVASMPEFRSQVPVRSGLRRAAPRRASPSACPKRDTRGASSTTGGAFGSQLAQVFAPAQGLASGLGGDPRRHGIGLRR